MSIQFGHQIPSGSLPPLKNSPGVKRGSNIENKLKRKIKEGSVVSKRKLKESSVIMIRILFSNRIETNRVYYGQIKLLSRF